MPEIVPYEDFSPFTDHKVELVDDHKLEDGSIQLNAGDDWSPFAPSVILDGDQEAEEEGTEGAEAKSEESEEGESAEADASEETEEVSADESKDEEEVDYTEPKEGDKPFMVGLRRDAKWAREFQEKNKDVEPVMDSIVKFGRAWLSGDLEAALTEAAEINKGATREFISAISEVESEETVAAKYGIDVETLAARLAPLAAPKMSDGLESTLDVLPDSAAEEIREAFRVSEIAAKERDAIKQQLNALQSQFGEYQETVFRNYFMNDYENLWSNAARELAEEANERGITIDSKTLESVKKTARADFHSPAKADPNRSLLNEFYAAVRNGESEKQQLFRKGLVESALKNAIKEELTSRNINLSTKTGTKTDSAKPEVSSKKKLPPVVQGKGAPGSKPPKVVSSDEYFKLSRADQMKVIAAGIEQRKAQRR